MIVTWLGHAGLFINAAQRSLLVDPWFTEAPDGAVIRYPPPPFPDATRLPPPDVLVLSGSDDTRASEDTLRQLRVSTRVVAMPSPVLRDRVAKVGFTNVTWGEPNIALAPFPGVSIRFLGDASGDGASLLIEADGTKLFVGGVGGDLRGVAPVDLAFLRFDSFVEAIDAVQPTEAVPFAGGAIARLNPFANRLTTNQVLARSMKHAHEKGTHLSLLSPGDEWSPETGPIHKSRTAGWDEDAASVARYLAQ